MKADDLVDVTNLKCPTTFIKVKIFLDSLEIGQILEVLLNEGEPIQNIPRTLEGEGHTILEKLDNKNGTYTLFVKKES